MKVHSDGGTGSGSPTVVPDKGQSVVTPIALEFMTKVAQSVNEPAPSPPVIKATTINSNVNNKQPVTTAAVSSVQPTAAAGKVPSVVPTTAAAATVQPQKTTVVVSTPPITVNPGPPNYASVVMKQNQVAKSAAAVVASPGVAVLPTTATASTTTVPSTVSASSTVPHSSALVTQSPSSSSSTGAETSIPKSTIPTATSNRSTTSSSSAVPIQQQQQPSKVSFANKVVSGPPPPTTTGGVHSSNVTPKQQTSTTPSINHVKGSVPVTSGSITDQQKVKQAPASDLRKVDGDLNKPPTGTMGSKVSKTVEPPPVAETKPTVVTNEVKPSAPPAPVTRMIPKANSTGDLQSIADRQQHTLVTTPDRSSSSDGKGSLVKTVADSSTEPITAIDPSVKPAAIISSGNKISSKGLPAIPEVSSSKPSSVSSPSSEASNSPSPTESLTNHSTPIVNNLVNDSKVTSTSSLTKDKKSTVEVPKVDTLPSANEVTSSVVDEPSSVTVDEGDTTGGKIIEEGEIDEDEDIVEEPMEVVDPTADIDRFNKNGTWRYDRDDLITFSKLPLSRSRPPFDKEFVGRMSKHSSIILEQVSPHRCRRDQFFFTIFF